jgi:acyl-CoA reductase-like NAD-dependent aldehyde dehydrogenase
VEHASEQLTQVHLVDSYDPEVTSIPMIHHPARDRLEHLVDGAVAVLAIPFDTEEDVIRIANSTD